MDSTRNTEAEVAALTLRTTVAPVHSGTAMDNLRGIPCHSCGAIIKIYEKPQWYAIIKGLEVGVQHTWYDISLFPAVTC